MDSPLSVLRKFWRHQQFRPLQEEIIHSVLAGKDTLALLPTGGGKSVCFQVPAMVLNGLCVVVTPLISLMRDQVEQLRQREILAVAVHSGLHRDEIDTLLDNCVYGDIKFLYVSPERLETELFRERFKRMRICLLSVDEAHCVSQWGYDFRPSYLRIASLRELKPDIPVIALTATADQRVQKDIMDHLAFRPEAGVFRKSFARENLSFVARKNPDKYRKMLEIFQKVPGSGIVYVRSRKATQQVAEFLQKNGMKSTYYHAGRTVEERIRVQDEWIRGQSRVIVATNAFGMGIDKPDVRIVIHLDVPENLESYYQEAGRAGRDNKRSYAVIVYSDADIDKTRARVLQSYPPLELLSKVYQCIANYYQIPEGSGAGESYDFDLTEFSTRFNLNSIEVYNAVKKLEEEGLLVMNDSFYNPSRVHFLVDTDKLYQFQIANATFDALIKMLLRLHGGELFTGYARIHEASLAKALGTTPPSVISLLQRLDGLRILKYEPLNDRPQLTLVLQRQDANHLPVDRKRLDERRKLMAAKADAMGSFIRNEYRCRMQVIQEYFDEVSYAECGICDVCISKRKKENKVELDLLKQEILKALSSHILPLDDLENMVKPTHSDLFVEVVRDLLDEDVIAYDEVWNLRKV